jgi:hypothetical protein
MASDADRLRTSLTALDDREFQRIVVDELRGKLDASWRTALSRPELAGRWYMMLDTFTGPDAAAAELAKADAIAGLASATPDQIAEMDFRTFRVLVEADTKGRGTPALRRLLRQPSVVDRWYDALVSLQKSVEGTIASKQRDFASMMAGFELKMMDADTPKDRLRVNRDMRRAQQRHATWKASAVRFKTGLDQRLVEARRLMHTLPSEPHIAQLTSERNDALGRAYLLERAIKQHRDTFPPQVDPSEADQQLWSYI